MPAPTNQTTAARHKVLLWWLVGLGLATGAGLLARAPELMGPGPSLPRLPMPPASIPRLFWDLGIGSPTWYLMVFALPLLVWGARRVDAQRLGRARTIGLGVATIVVLVMITGLIQYLVTYRGLPLPSRGGFLMMVVRRNVLPWVAILGVVVAIESRRRARVGVLEGERLRAQVAEQRLLTLTSQLQPHFLFNTLQGISTLLHRNPTAADEMLTRLADLLREVLRHRDKATVPLEDELRYAQAFLEISQFRFGDRLTFTIDAPSTLHHFTVPLLILQPLLENALTHGIGNRLEGGHVALAVRQGDDRLHIEVRDDGMTAVGVKRDLSEGLGLSNTRARLQAAFGGDFQLAVEPGVAGGMVVRIDIPAIPFQAAGA